MATIIPTRRTLESFRPERAIAALLGSMVGDAATTPLHWIYDVNKLHQLVREEGAHFQSKPEFFPKPSCPFYSPKEYPGHYDVGQLSPYAEQHMALLQFMKNNSSSFPGGKEFSQFFAQWAAEYSGRKDHPTKAFEENFHRSTSGGGGGSGGGSGGGAAADDANNGRFSRCGADDDQANAFLKVVPITIRYAGQPELEEKIKEAILVQQFHSRSVAYGKSFARMLEAVILGAELDEAFGRARSAATTSSQPFIEGIDERQHDSELDTWLDYVLEQKAHSKIDSVFVEELSQKVLSPDSKVPDNFRKVASLSCSLPQSFVIPIKILVTANPDRRAAFSESIRENILVGGDNSSRACVVGSMLGALGGLECIPKDWISRTKVAEEVRMIGQSLVDAATKSGQN